MAEARIEIDLSMDGDDESHSPPILSQDSTAKPDPKVEPLEKSLSRQSLAESDSSLTMDIVLEFLRKNNLTRTEASLQQELSNSSSSDPTKGTSDLDIEMMEVGKQSASILDLPPTTGEQDTNENSVGARYRSLYAALRQVVEVALDKEKMEIASLLYPLFIYMYIRLLVSTGPRAVEFYEEFAECQPDEFKDVVDRLGIIRTREHAEESDLIRTFLGYRFSLRMSRQSLSTIRRHITGDRLDELSTLLTKHVYVEYVDSNVINDPIKTTGSIMGQTLCDWNSHQKVYYGLLKEPDLPMGYDVEDEEPQAPPTSAADANEKPSKRKRIKRDVNLQRRQRIDPNGPPDRINLPTLRDTEKLERYYAFKETLKQVKITESNPPSVCMYTVHNATLTGASRLRDGLTCIDVTEDSTMLAAGFQDSSIRVWTLTDRLLRPLKTSTELAQIDLEAPDIQERVLDDRRASEVKHLVGHRGPVFSASFSPDKNFIVSGGEDGIVRLWSTHLWMNLVAYRGHMYPVWATQFAPVYGHYFVTGGADRAARLWATSSHLPLRIFSGHLSDVDSVAFHPNINYVATGSSDCSVRLWDIKDGRCVRILTSHKGAVHSLAFSPDGRYLASGGVDKIIHLWDVNSAKLTARFVGHTSLITSIDFTRDGACMTSGGLDNTVKFWNIDKVLDQFQSDKIEDFSPMISFSTKETPIQKVHFTRRNLCMTVGSYMHDT